jgi:hypothetical protein
MRTHSTGTYYQEPTQTLKQETELPITETIKIKSLGKHSKYFQKIMEQHFLLDLFSHSPHSSRSYLKAQI